MIRTNIIVDTFAVVNYGEGQFSAQAYAACEEGDITCLTAVDSSAQAGTPNTGLLQQPFFIIPLIIGLAVILVGIEYLVRRHASKARAKTPTDQSDPR